MSSLHGDIERFVATAARRHDTFAVGTFAGGEAAFFESRTSELRLFEIGSITKPFTGVLLADMSLAGELSLDDPLTNHLPDVVLPLQAVLAVPAPATAAARREHRAARTAA